MKRSSALIALVLMALPAAASRTSAQFQSARGEDTIAVRVYATVYGSGNRPVKDLKKEDFAVLSDGRPVAATFSSAPQPLTATLMLDMSNSGLDQIEQLQTAATKFVDALGPDDRIKIGTFGSEIFTTPLLTRDRTYLMRVLSEELWPGGPTPLWPGIDAAVSSLSGEPGRRVVIVFTDGSDYLGVTNRPTRATVEKRVADEGVIVYTVTYRGFVFDYGVRTIASQSGGRNFELPLDADLGEVLARIVDELRQQYVFEFTAPRDGNLHSLSVRVNIPGLTPFSRTSYVAK